MSRILVSQLSLRETLADPRFTPSDLPALMSRRGFDGLEMMDRTLGCMERPQRRDFAAACEENDCAFILDICCDLTYEEDSTWQSEIEHVHQMLDLAVELRSLLVKIWLGGQTLSVQRLLGRIRRRSRNPSQRPETSSAGLRRLLSNRKVGELAHAIRARLPSATIGRERKIARAIAALERILPRAEALRLHLAIENHWGISSRPEAILRVIETSSSSHLGACLDFGNWPRGVDLHQSLELLAPRAFLVHAKSSRFTADGESREFDYARCLRILRAAGYDGDFTIEYVGPGDELEGCARTQELIRRYW